MNRMRRPLQFMRNLASGDAGPVQRARRVVGNLTHRDPRTGCCGNYGEPGC